MLCFFFSKMTSYVLSYAHKFQNRNIFKMQLFMLPFIYYCVAGMQYALQKNVIIRNTLVYGTFQRLEMCEIFKFYKTAFLCSKKNSINYNINSIK